jgi:hypothetical protein
MLSAKNALKYALPGYAAGLIFHIFIPFFLAMAISSVITAGLVWVQLKKEGNPPSLPQANPSGEQARPLGNPADAAAPSLANSKARSSSTVSALAAQPHSEWDQVLEYIGTIQDMVILEGNHNNLDNEIVGKNPYPAV